jgi:hypothetical protein
LKIIILISEGPIVFFVIMLHLLYFCYSIIVNEVSSQDMNDEAWLPRIDEPMEDYLTSERYRRSATAIIFSDFNGQEETNYFFWRHLTPIQRLELHTIEVASLYAAEINKNADKCIFEIVFNENIS